MPRKPTPGDLKVLRRMMARAGSAFRLWMKRAEQLPIGKRGPHVKDDDDWLLGLEWLCRTAKRELGISRTATIRWFVEGVSPIIKTLGASESAFAARLYRKLGEQKFKRRFKRSVAALEKRGIDPSRFTFEVLNEGH